MGTLSAFGMILSISAFTWESRVCRERHVSGSGKAVGKSKITVKYDKYNNDGDKAGVGVAKGVQRKTSKSNWDKDGQEKFSRKEGLLTLNSEE